MATLEITTLIGCPLACTFCPQDALTVAYGSSSERMLSFEKFKIILNKLPSHVRIDFSGMSEPFANPSCIDMVALAAASKNPIAIYTTLAGLTRSAVDHLVELIRARRFSISHILQWGGASPVGACACGGSGRPQRSDALHRFFRLIHFQKV